MAEMDAEIRDPDGLAARHRMADALFEIRQRREVAHRIRGHRQAADHAGIDEFDLDIMRIDRLRILIVGEIETGLQRLAGKAEPGCLPHCGMGTIGADQDIGSHLFGRAIRTA